MNKNYINLKKKKVKELKQMCKDNKIKGYSKLRKKELVKKLFETLYPNEDKEVIEEVVEVVKEPVEVVVEEVVEEVVKEPVEVVIEDVIDFIEHPLKIKLNILNDIPPITKPIEEIDDFEDKYNELLKLNIEKLKKKKEKKIIPKNIIDLNDVDYINTINNLILKLF